MDLLIQSVVAVLLVVITMYVAIHLVRFAASILISVLGFGGCGFAVFQVASGKWSEWPGIVLYSVFTGLCVALLSLPVLPFRSLNKKV